MVKTLHAAATPLGEVAEREAAKLGHARTVVANWLNAINEIAALADELAEKGYAAPAIKIAAAGHLLGTMTPAEHLALLLESRRAGF